MKKTITIAACCLASPLWAADFSVTLEDITSTNNTITVMDYALGDITAYTVLTLDVNAIKTYLKSPSDSLTNIVSLKVEKIQNNQVSATNNVGLSFYGKDFVAHDGSSGKNGALTDTITIEAPKDVTTSLESIDSIFTTDVTNAVITYSHSSEGSIAYLTVMKKDGTMLNYADKRAAYRATGSDRYVKAFTFNDKYVLSADAHVADSAISATDAFALNQSKLVPEPTTATLSLLALAGLAARRRRK